MSTSTPETESRAARLGRRPHLIRDTVICSILILTIGFCGIVLLGALTRPDGKHWLDDPGIVIVAFLGAFATAASVIYPFVLKFERNVETTRADVAAVREQVENGHVENPTKTSNIRVDLDHKPDRDEVQVMITRALEGVAGRIDNTMNLFMQGVNMHFKQLGGQVTDAVDDIHGIRKEQSRVARRLEENQSRLDALGSSAAEVSHVRETVDTMAVQIGAVTPDLPEGEEHDE